LESYLVEIGRGEHEPISDDRIAMLRNYGEKGEQALRRRGLTEEEIGRPPKPPPLETKGSAVTGQDLDRVAPPLETKGFDWIYSSERTYAKARGYRGPRPHLFQTELADKTFSHFDANNGNPRYILSDPKLHAEVKAEVVRLEAEKWKRRQKT
jgi:hypothetical protein